MEIIFKVVGVGIIASIACVILRPIKPEFAIAISLAGSLLILLFIMQYLSPLFSSFDELVLKTGLNTNLISLILKIVGIGYLVEFGANLCEDTGNSNLADRITLAGKIVILVMALPIVESILEIIVEILP